MKFLLLADSNRRGKISGKLDATIGKELACERFKVIASVGVADGSDSLKIVDVHPRASLG